MPNHNGKTYQLVERLLDQTRLGKVEWREVDDVGTFSTAFAKYDVSIAPYRDSLQQASKAILNLPIYNEDRYFLTITEHNGQKVEQIVPVGSNSFQSIFELTQNPEASLIKSSLQELYAVVSNAYSKDKVFDELLQELGD